MDYNRAGIPLLEIVSEPDLRTGQEAAAYGAELRRILVYLGISDCNMSVSLLRLMPDQACSPNCSMACHRALLVRAARFRRLLLRARELRPQTIWGPGYVRAELCGIIMYLEIRPSTCLGV